MIGNVYFDGIFYFVVTSDLGDGRYEVWDYSISLLGKIYLKGFDSKTVFVDDLDKYWDLVDSKSVDGMFNGFIYYRDSQYFKVVNHSASSYVLQPVYEMRGIGFLEDTSKPPVKEIKNLKDYSFYMGN